MSSLTLRKEIKEVYFPPVGFVAHHFFEWDLDDFANFLREDQFHVFLCNYYLNLRVAEIHNMKDSEEKSKGEKDRDEFLSKMPQHVLETLWNQEGCSLSFRLKNQPEKASFIAWVPVEKKILLLYRDLEQCNKPDMSHVQSLKAQKRLFTLLLFLPSDYYQQLQNLGFFQEFSEKAESIFTREEILFFAEWKPDLFDKVEIGEENHRLQFLKTLETQTKLEFEQIYELMDAEFQSEVSLLLSKPKSKSPIVLVRNGLYFFRLDYLNQMLKLFRQEKRTAVLKLIGESHFRDKIQESDWEILQILVKKDS